ncbi:MAG: redoxin domain-containing protein [Nitrospira sp.]|nr:redoxin domain-containing protein [Nitrospira sp.]
MPASKRPLLIGTMVGLLLAAPQLQAAIGMKAPDFVASVWINSGPQSVADLQGKVVLVEFWTFGCYNCRNVEPYVKAWHKKYAHQGLVVIGVHSPEFKYEHDVEKVKRYADEHGITYAIPIDNDFAIWNRYGNRYWPVLYLIDKQGVIRYVRVGEGGHQETERVIRSLLTEP